MIRPRPYLSYSQLVAIEASDRTYIQRYIEDKKFTSRAMAFGKKVAEALENDDVTGDPLLDLVIAQLPKYELRDREFRMTLIGEKHDEDVPLLIRPDSARLDLSGIYEYKTGAYEWTQRMVDENDQITFYTTGAYIKTRKIPTDLELIWAPTEKDEETGVISIVGTIERFRTKRDMKDVLRMMVRMRKAWKKIGQVCESELV